jgi:hypothetical protein
LLAGKHYRRSPWATDQLQRIEDAISPDQIKGTRYGEREMQALDSER